MTSSKLLYNFLWNVLGVHERRVLKSRETVGEGEQRVLQKAKQSLKAENRLYSPPAAFQ